MAQTATLKLEDTQFLLEEWARWAHTYSVKSVSWPTIQPYRRLRGTSVKSALICDDDAAIIDKVVSKLIHRDKEMGMVVVCYYLSGSNTRYVMRELDIAKNRARILLEAGTAWIDAALDAHRNKFMKAS